MAKVVVSEKTMWAAFVDDWGFDGDEPTVHIVAIQTMESDKQYKVCNEKNLDIISRRALHYKSVINKSDNKILFNTRDEAATALYEVVLQEQSKREHALAVATRNLMAVKAAI